MRCGLSKQVTVVGRVESASNHTLLSFALDGMNPSIVNGITGNPYATTAASGALGPGIGSTAISRSRQA